MSRIISVFVVGLCVFTALKDIITAVRGTDVELLVTNLDLISTGHAPDGYTPCTISRADIYNLEFREATGGGDVSDSPRGLYVEHRGCTPWNSNSCVLPHINEPQTGEVIKAICSRFPDTGNLPPTGPFEPYLTSLNLNTPKRDWKKVNESSLCGGLKCGAAYIEYRVRKGPTLLLYEAAHGFFVAMLLRMTPFFRCGRLLVLRHGALR